MNSVDKVCLLKECRVGVTYTGKNLVVGSTVSNGSVKAMSANEIGISVSFVNGLYDMIVIPYSNIVNFTPSEEKKSK